MLFRINIKYVIDSKLKLYTKGSQKELKYKYR